MLKDPDVTSASRMTSSKDVRRPIHFVASPTVVPISVAKVCSLPVSQDKEIHILLEDQQRINKFARLNNRLEDLREEVKARRSEVQTLEDASTDIMMLEDDEEKVETSAAMASFVSVGTDRLGLDLSRFHIKWVKSSYT